MAETEVKSKKSNKGCCIGLGCGGLVIAGFIGVAALVGQQFYYEATAHNNTSSLTAKVTKTAVLTDRDHRSTGYLVYTDKETLANYNNPFADKHDADELHGRLENGCTYRFDVYGERDQKLRRYRNILSAEPLHCD